MFRKEAQDEKRRNVRIEDGKRLVLFMETCCRLYEQKMYQVACRILQDSEWAEDAVQEAFLKLMKGRVYFEDACSDDCKKYMITVIKHSAIDIYHKKKKEQELFCFSDEMTYSKKAGGQDFEEEAGGKEIISLLSPWYYQVVDCLAVKNLSVKEMAEKLGISEVNVRKRFERAKKKLKQAVKK